MPELAVEVLTEHTVVGRFESSDLFDGQLLETFAGTQIVVSEDEDGSFAVGDAPIILVDQIPVTTTPEEVDAIAHIVSDLVEPVEVSGQAKQSPTTQGSTDAGAGPSVPQDGVISEIFHEGLKPGWTFKKYGSILYSTTSPIAYSGDVGLFVAIPPLSALSLESFNLESVPSGAVLRFRVLNGPSLESAGGLSTMIGKKYVGKLSEHIASIGNISDEEVEPFEDWTLVYLVNSNQGPESAITLLNTSQGFVSCYIDDMDIVEASLLN